MGRIIDAVRWRDAPKLLLALYVGFWTALLVHEVGHYGAARAFGIVPTEVSIGHFGPAFTTEWEGTKFVLRPVANPLGRASTDIGPGQIAVIGLLAILLAGTAANLVGGILVLGLGIVERSAFLLVIALAFFAMGLGQMVPVRSTDGFRAMELFRHGKIPEMPSPELRTDGT
jgi:hypothetical protein